jgi:hypothetical protein
VLSIDKFPFSTFLAFNISPRTEFGRSKLWGFDSAIFPRVKRAISTVKIASLFPILLKKLLFLLFYP